MGVISSMNKEAYRSGSYNPALCPLTPAQVEMVQMLADGKMRKQVADHFGVSEVTIHKQLQEACDRATVVNKDFALVAKALRMGWIN